MATHDDGRTAEDGTKTHAAGVPRRPQPRGKLIDSESLFAGATEIGIAHGADVYRLRITRQGKLILNK